MRGKGGGDMSPSVLAPETAARSQAAGPDGPAAVRCGDGAGGRQGRRGGEIVSASGLSPAVSTKDMILLLYRQLGEEQKKAFMAMVKTVAAQNDGHRKDEKS